MRSNRNLLQSFWKEFSTEEGDVKWLSPITEEQIDLAMERNESGESKQAEMLEKAQRMLGLGRFELKYDRKNQSVKVKYIPGVKKSIFPDCKGFVEILGCSDAIPLSKLLKGEEITRKVDRTRASALIEITLTSGGEILKFVTVAKTNLIQKSRIEGVRTKLIDSTDQFFAYLRVLVEFAPGRGGFGGGGKPKKKRKKGNTNLVERDISSNLIEILLMAQDPSSTASEIDRALGTLKKVPGEAKKASEFIEIWKQFKRAAKEFRRGA
jgi:hypothetical protein